MLPGRREVSCRSRQQSGSRQLLKAVAQASHDVVEGQHRALPEGDDHCSPIGVSTVLQRSRGPIGASDIPERESHFATVVRLAYAAADAGDRFAARAHLVRPDGVVARDGAPSSGFPEPADAASRWFGRPVT